MEVLNIVTNWAIKRRTGLWWEGFGAVVSVEDVTSFGGNPVLCTSMQGSCINSFGLIKSC